MLVEVEFQMSEGGILDTSGGGVNKHLLGVVRDVNEDSGKCWAGALNRK